MVHRSHLLWHIDGSTGAFPELRQLVLVDSMLTSSSSVISVMEVSLSSLVSSRSSESESRSSESGTYAVSDCIVWAVTSWYGWDSCSCFRLRRNSKRAQ